MRRSHCQRILEIERERRQSSHGRTARLTQLSCATAALLALFVFMSYRRWRHPTPVSHAWIDEVLVEVLEDNWADAMREVVMWLCVACGSVLTALTLCTTPLTSGSAPSDLQAQEPSVMQQNGFVPQPSTLAASGARVPAATTATAVAAGCREDGEASSRPVRHANALDEFLTRVSRTTPSVDPTRAGAGGVAPSLRTSFAPSVAELGATTEGGIAVSYDGVSADRAGGSGGSSSTTSGQHLSDADWAALSIFHVDAALQRTREFLSDVCSRLINDVECCDRWLSERHLQAYDCNHSLQEVLPAPPTTTSVTGFGVLSAPAQPSAPLTKLSAIVEEKRRIQQSAGQDFDVVLRFDQRLALEGRLDVTSTFPQTAPLPNVDLAARQQYNVRRLRTFAKQRTLASYQHGGGDPETWRPGFPCDAHLLLHVLRTAVEGMSHCVRFGYQRSANPQDLAIYVGDTGEPYFYVRYRSPAMERLYATRPGPQSLMEAMLVFVAVVQVHHHGVYSNIHGTIDLKRAGMQKLLKERPTTGWAGVF